MAYTPRLNDSGMANNPKWYSQNPFYQSGYGLPNCTCYCWGRFWEISDPNNEGINPPNLSMGNGKDWWGYNLNNNIYESGQIPKLGAILCFTNNVSGSNGHVATVEEIHEGYIVTSNSDWGGRYFYLETLYPDANNLYHHATYWSQGFIYNPYADQPEPPVEDSVKKKHFPYPVAWRHWHNFKR